MRITWVGSLLFSMICVTAMAGDLADDPYVKLFTQKINLAKIEAQRQEAILNLYAGKRDRAQRLISSHSLSREEYEEACAGYAVASQEMKFYEGKVAEAEALLEVVKHLRQKGQEVPLR